MDVKEFFKLVGKDANIPLSEQGRYLLSGKNKASYLASRALNSLAKLRESGFDGRVGIFVKNMNAETQEGVKVFIYTEDDVIVGKRIVLATEDGNPTESPAPDGEHIVGNMKLIVENGVISSAEEVSEAQNASNAEEEKTPAVDAAAAEPEPESEIAKAMKKMEAMYNELQGAKNQIKILMGTQTSKPIEATNSSKIIVSGSPVKLKDGSIAKKAFDKAMIKYGKNANEIAFTNNDWSGLAYMEIMSEALLSGDSVERGLITVMEGIKSKKRLTKAEVVVKFQDNTDTFTPATDDLAIDFSKVWTVNPYSVQQRIAWDKLRESFWEDELNAGTFSDSIPPQQFMAWYIARITEKIAIMNESLYWRGKAYTTGANFTAGYDGLLTKCLASTTSKKARPSAGVAVSLVTIANPAVFTCASTANVKDGDVVSFLGFAGGTLTPVIEGRSFQIRVISATTFSLVDYVSGVAFSSVGLTVPTTYGTLRFINESNIIASLKLLLTTMNPNVRSGSNKDFKIFIPTHLELAYMFAISENAKDGGDYYISSKEKSFLGEKMEVVSYMHDNTIFGNSVKNQFLGCDLLLDSNQIRVINEAEFSQNEFVSAKVSMKTDVLLGFDHQSSIVSALVP